MISTKNQKCHMCLQKVTSQSLVVLSIRHHYTGYPTHDPPKRSRDYDHIVLKSTRNVFYSGLRNISCQALEMTLQLGQNLCRFVLWGWRGCNWLFPLERPESGWSLWTHICILKFLLSVLRRWKIKKKKK